MPKKTLHFPALMLFGIYALYSFVLYPLNEKITYDVVLSETALTYVLGYFLPLFEGLGLAASFGFLTYSIYRYGIRRTTPFFILNGIALLFKSATNFISFSAVSGSLQFNSAGFRFLESLLLTNLMECVLIALTAALAHFGIRHLEEKNRKKKSACLRLKKDFAPEGETYPFKRPFNRKNPLLCAIMGGCLTYIAFRFFVYLATMISYHSSLEFYWIIIMLFTSVLLPAVSCYFLSLFCIKLSDRDRVRLEAIAAAEAEAEAAEAEDDE